MPWIVLVLAGLLEVAWASLLPATEGFRRIPQTALFVVFLAGSMYGLAYSARSIPVGTAYGVWVGVGVVGTAVVGIALRGEAASLGRVLALAALLGSLFAVKATSGA